MDNGERIKIIIIAGPTATGKSRTAIELASLIGGEVISADSVQVYRGLDIGSAKISREEMCGIRHHLIDIMDFDQAYSAFLFRSMGRAAIEDIAGRGKIPIICGGTGFYIQALIYDIDFAAGDDTDEEKEAKKSARKHLEELLHTGGETELLRMLSQCDSYTYETIDRRNIRKVIRALEFQALYGKSLRRHNEEQAKKRENPPYDIRFFVLNGNRMKLYDRIDKRVGSMMAAGLLDEVKSLRDRGLSRDMAAGQAIGYKEILGYLDGELSLLEATEKIRLNTRHFAKRQLTWFRREKNAVWIDIDGGNVPDEIRKYL